MNRQKKSTTIPPGSSPFQSLLAQMSEGTINKNIPVPKDNSYPSAAEIPTQRDFVRAMIERVAGTIRMVPVEI